MLWSTNLCLLACLYAPNDCLYLGLPICACQLANIHVMTVYTSVYRSVPVSLPTFPKWLFMLRSTNLCLSACPYAPNDCLCLGLPICACQLAYASNNGSCLGLPVCACQLAHMPRMTVYTSVYQSVPVILPTCPKWLFMLRSTNLCLPTCLCPK